MMDPRSTLHFRLRRPAKVVAASVAALALGAGLAACGGNSDSSAPVGGQTSAAPDQTGQTGQTSQPDPSTDSAPDESTAPAADSVLDQQQAADLLSKALDAITSAKVSMAIDLKSQGTMEAEGVMQVKPSAEDLTMTVAGQKMEMRLLGSNLYMHLPAAAGLGDKWMKLGLADLSKLGMGSISDGLSNPATMLSSYAKYVKQAKYIGKDTVDGQSVDHYTFTIDEKGIVAQMYPSGMPSGAGAVKLPNDLTVDEWLDSEGRPVQQRTDMGSLGTMTVTMSDFGTKVDVQAPPAAQTTDMSDMLGSLGGSALTGL